MVSPAGVAVDAFGRLHVADGALHRLLRFDSNGDWLGESGALGSGAGQFRRPGSVVAAGALLIAVLDIENRRIASYDLFGRLQGIAVDLGGDAVSAAAGRVDPVALAADRGGALYVADANQDRILVFDPAGRLSRTVGRFGDGAGAFRGLAGLAVTRAGEIVATEREGARVQRLDPSGRPLAAWPLAVRAAGASLPVAVDDSLRVAVADGASGRLWLFDRHGRVLAARDGLAAPGALAFAADGALWVAEAGAGRVTRWLPEPRGEEPLEPGAR
jgi:sugar lactone lactonase YvrE